jgi:hypothetical protein
MRLQENENLQRAYSIETVLMNHLREKGLEDEMKLLASLTYSYQLLITDVKDMMKDYFS